MGKTKENNTDLHDSPMFWFYALEAARRKNDFERAAAAKRELARLGVVVQYKRVKTKAAGGER